MKKKLITIFSLCATLILAVCSVGMKKANAEEPIATSEITYSDNLFSSISYRELYQGNYIVHDNYISKYNLEGGVARLNTNIMPLEESDKDLLISMKFRLGDIIDMTKTVDATDVFMTGIKLYDENYKKTDSFYLEVQGNTEIKFETYKLDSSGQYVTVNIVHPNPNYSNQVETKCKYFNIEPQLKYYNYNGEGILENGSAISEMYVSFIEKDTITSQEELEGINVDYTPYSSGFTWDCKQVSIDSNYLGLKVSETFVIETVVEAIKVTNQSGEICTLDYGSTYDETIHLQGFKYEYILHAYDNNGKHEFLLVSLNIVDNEAPVINGNKEYTVPNGSLLSVNAIKQTLIVTDNNDNTEDITISIEYDYYTENYETPGVYYVCFVATDKSGNSSKLLVRINVTDKNAPVFYDEYNIQRTKCTVYKSVDSVLVMSDIISKYKAIDEVDGELEIKIHTDKYTGNGETPGKYNVMLKAVDKSNNVTYFTVTIVVSEDMPSKTILINEKYIVVEKNIKLTKNDFHSIIKLLGTYNANTTSYTTINSEIYSTSYNEIGDYLVEYTIVTTSGYETNDVFSVSVVNSRTGGAVIDEKEKEDGIIVSFFKWIWNLILSFFEWIGSLFE